MYVESDGEDVDIYVMDTGIKIEHDDFGGRFVHCHKSKMIIVCNGVKVLTPMNFVRNCHIVISLDEERTQCVQYQVPWVPYFFQKYLYLRSLLR